MPPACSGDRAERSASGILFENPEVGNDKIEKPAYQTLVNEVAGL
jgi:hypothetical protein